MLGLIFSMQSASVYNAHPDEANHIDAARYYVKHWIPPKFDSRKSIKTRSGYGLSYLDDFELVYLLSGKFYAALGTVFPSDMHAFRALNLILAFIMVLLIFRAAEPLPLAIFFISAQAWYVFSYVNGDAFSLFVTFLSVHSLLRLQRLCRSPFDEKSTQESQRLFLFQGVIIGLLTLSKMNYVSYLFFLVSFLFWLVLRCKDKQQRKVLRNGLVLACLVGIVIYGLRNAVETAANGLNRREKLMAVAERVADPPFKPSTTLEKTYYGLRLREKGVTFAELFSKWNWHIGSFKSFVGLYGYVSFPSAEGYYQTIKYLYVLIIALLLWKVCRARNLDSWVVLALCLAGAALVMAASLHRSWTFDFQAQGRYLFPILPMVAFLAGVLEQGKRDKVLALLCALCILAGMHSFVYSGLGSIPCGR